MTVSIQAERSFPCRGAMAVYDCFEAACEALLGKTEAVFVRLRDGELLMMAVWEYVEGVWKGREERNSGKQ